MRGIEIIERELAELMPDWENDQMNVDLSRRIARLWEERYEQLQDSESLDGAVWYANHLNTLLNGSDPAVARKLADLQRKRAVAGIKKVEADIKPIEQWLAGDGQGHTEEAKYREHLAEMQRHLADLKLELAGMKKPSCIISPMPNLARPHPADPKDEQRSGLN